MLGMWPTPGYSDRRRRSSVPPSAPELGHLLRGAMLNDSQPLLGTTVILVLATILGMACTFPMGPEDRCAYMQEWLREHPNYILTEKCVPIDSLLPVYVKPDNGRTVSNDVSGHD